MVKRQQLLSVLPLCCLVSVALDARGAAANDAAERIVRDLSSFGSRVVGYRGLRRAADYVEREFKAIGLQGVARQEFKVAAPVEEFASLTLPDGETIPLRCFFPNVVHTPTLPPAGVTGELLYGGKSAYRDYNGREGRGRIVLLDFDCGDQWVNAFALGARRYLRRPRTRHPSGRRAEVPLPAAERPPLLD